MLLLFINLLSFAQPPVSLPVTMLDNIAGMLHGSNYFCYKDSRDLLWMSSYNGLHRFDGKNIKVFLPNPNDTTSIVGKAVVSFIREDEEDNIWFGTDRALNCFVREKGGFEHFNFSENDEGEFKVLGIDAMGNIWLTFDGYIYTFERDTRQFKTKARIDLNHLRGEVVLMTEFLLNKKKEVTHTFSYGSYLDDPGLEIHEFENDELVRDHIYFNKSSKLPLRIRDVYPIKDSMLLIAALSGFYEFNLSSKSIKHLLPTGKGKQNGCTGIGAFSDSTLLLAMLSAEYIEYNLNDNKVIERYILDNNGTDLKEIPWSVNVDSDGGIYIHLVNNGLAYFHPKNLLFKHRKYKNTSGNQSRFISLRGGMLETNDGRVFACSKENGGFLFSENGKLLETFNTESPGQKRIPNNRINSCIKDSKGRIWLFHYSRYISIFDDPELETISSFEVDEMFWKGIELPSGQLIFLPRKGLLTSDIEQPGKPSFQKLEGVDSTLQFNNIERHPNGLLLTGEFKRSLFSLDPAQSFKIINRVPFNYLINQRQWIEGTDDYLMGSTNGAYYFDSSLNTFSLLDFCKCGPNASINCFLPIGEQQYLISSDKGVCTIDLKNKSSALFGIEHGLGVRHFSQNSSLKHSNGTFWLGSKFGITTCDSRPLNKPVLNNRVNICGLLINDHSYDNQGVLKDLVSNIDEVQQINLNYTSNTISFEFAAFSYAGINKHTYEYRMLSLEKQWVEGGDRGFARYSNLKPESYIFEVRVKGQPNTVRRVEVNINPPLYGRLWFQFLIAVFSILLIYFVIRARNKRKQQLQQLRFERRLALEQERVRIATDMHDDVGSGLSALNMRARVLADKVTDSALKLQVNLLVDNSRLLTHKIREIIWTVNAQNDTVENLVTRLHQYALEFFEETEINCHIDLMQDQDTSPISGTHRREIYLAFKEALHNIFKHAKATQVSISIEIKNDRLLIDIKDDGLGFDSKNLDIPGYGLKSMQRRMDLIKGSFDISSNSGGTNVSFQYPISQPE